MINDDTWNLIAKKLSGEASPDELLELEKALKLNPDLHYSLQAIHDLWKTHPSTQHALAEKAFEKHKERLRSALLDFAIDDLPQDYPEIFPVKNTKRLFRSAAIGAGFMLIFSAIYFAVQPHPKTAPEFGRPEQKKSSEVVTQYGTRTKLLLPDGTSVWLNAGSRLTYDSTYGTPIREVSLTGEGFFDVVKNKQKPFIIHTGNINIKVLGTAFNVKSYPGDKTIETSLLRGSIEVTFKDHSLAKVILKPNQKLVVPSEEANTQLKNKISNTASLKPVTVINHLSHFGADSLITETAWVENLLVFQDESFTDLAKKMERWYGIRIKIDDESLDTLHFTGSFEKENIQQALKALQLLSNFNFTIQTGEAHILKTH